MVGTARWAVRGYRSAMSLPISCERLVEFLRELRLLCGKGFLARNFFLQFHQTSKQRFRARRAPGNVNIDRQKLIDPLENGVGAIHAAGGSARSHCDYPFWLGHLFVNPFYCQRHFVSDRAGDNHHIALSWRKTHYLRAEPRDVESRGSRGH